MNNHPEDSQPEEKLKYFQNENQDVVVKCVAGNYNNAGRQDLSLKCMLEHMKNCQFSFSSVGNKQSTSPGS